MAHLPMSEVQLFHALRQHYPPQQFALLPQVGNATGFGTNRHADAVALGLWPSRGIHLHGFEIKSHRGDWKRELEKPEKAEEIAQYCNHWWIVAAHDGIVGDDLPHGWGLFIYEAGTQSLTKKKAAPFRDGKSFGLDFIAAILRRAQEVVTPAAEVALAKEEAFKAGEESGKKHFKYLTDEYETLKKKVAQFQKASGVRIDQWRDAQRIGEAVEQVINGSIHRRREELLRVARLVVQEFDGTVEATK